MPIIFGAKNDFEQLEACEVENGLQFSDFTTTAHYIDFGGPVTLFHEADRGRTYVGLLPLPIDTFNTIFIWICQLFGFLATPST